MDRILIGHQSEYRLEYSNRVNAKGSFVRGFVGIEPLIIVTALIHSFLRENIQDSGIPETTTQDV